MCPSLHNNRVGIKENIISVRTAYLLLEASANKGRSCRAM